MTKIIECFNISKYLKKKDIIKNFNYVFEDQTSYILYGPIGSGKSLFLNIILKKETIKKGKIEICGENLNSFSKEKLMIYKDQIGFSPQYPILIEKKTIYENIEIAMFLSNIKKNIRKEKINYALEKLNLLSIKNKFPKDVSLGTKQIVSIIRAIIKKPKILLLDEPFNNIDTSRIDIIKDLIQEFIHPHSTIIISTNNDKVLELISDKTVINFPLIYN